MIDMRPIFDWWYGGAWVIVIPVIIVAAAVHIAIRRTRRK